MKNTKHLVLTALFLALGIVLLFSMPPMFSKAVAMAFELAGFGCLAGLLFRLFPFKNIIRIYLSLIGAMLGGRIIYGLVCIPLMGIAKVPYSFKIFFASTVIEALPGIILQLILIPVVLLALQRVNLIDISTKGNHHE